MRTYDSKSQYMQMRPSTEQEFFGSQLDLPTVTCYLDECTNLPISMASWDSRQFVAVQRILDSPVPNYLFLSTIQSCYLRC
jgi:hypothetical protein